MKRSMKNSRFFVAPRFLPAALAVMLALVGLKAAGMVHRAMAETVPPPASAGGAVHTTPAASKAYSRSRVPLLLPAVT